jgi:hypothetical protein
MKFLALQKQFKAYCRKVFCVQCMKKIILALKIINRRSHNLSKFWVSYVRIIGDAVSLVANSITLPILHKNNLHDISLFERQEIIPFESKAKI